MSLVSRYLPARRRVPLCRETRPNSTVPISAVRDCALKGEHEIPDDGISHIMHPEDVSWDPNNASYDHFPVMTPIFEPAVGAEVVSMAVDADPPESL